MHVWAGLLGVALLLSGCGGRPSQPAPATPAAQNGRIQGLDLSLRSRISLIQPNGRLRIGDARENARFLFPTPPKADEVMNLPFDLGDDFTAEGWDSGANGFGAVLFDNLVALALSTRAKVPDSDVNDVVQTYIQEVGRSADRSIITAKVRYWFWSDGIHRLMINATADGERTYRVSIALGHQQVMDRFRMGAQWATEDADAASRILENPSKNGKVDTNAEPNESSNP